MSIVSQIKQQLNVKRALNLAHQASMLGGDALAKATNAKKQYQKYADKANVKVNDNENTVHAFKTQIPKISKKLLGKRFVKISKMVTKVVPDSALDSATDKAFFQVAKLAEQWSRLDVLQKLDNQSFAQFDEQQQKQQARDVANQNRLLAAVGGGVTGFTGLLGLFADLMWLLLVSLRLIYQTAASYHQPLSGMQGIKIAYDVLAQADLTSLQHKQTVLLGMGAANQFIDQSDIQALQGALGSGNHTEFFVEQIGQVAEQFNIDLGNINLNWLTKILPIASSVTSAVYSVYVINEVAAAAGAAFAPKPALTHLT